MFAKQPQDTLRYSQNWEDPLLELGSLHIKSNDRILGVCSGACTVLSLLAEGPREFIAVDISEEQLRLGRLKLAAVCSIEPSETAALLLGQGTPSEYKAWVSKVSESLERADQSYWQSSRNMIGVLNQGRAERFVSGLARLVSWFIHPKSTTRLLLSLADLEEQKKFYADTWNSWRWRLLFKFLQKDTVNRGLDGAFYQHVEPGNLGQQLHRRFEARVHTQPCNENYFMARMLLGEYLDHPNGRPPYLTEKGAQSIRQHSTSITWERVSVVNYLRAQPEASIDKFYLSNVAEWLSEAERVELFTEICRVGTPGALVSYRALMCPRPLPQEVHAKLIVDHETSERLSKEDRAFVNAAFHLARVAHA